MTEHGIACPAGGGGPCGCASPADCYRRRCDALSARLLGAARAGATPREIDRIFAAGMVELGAPGGEIRARVATATGGRRPPDRERGGTG